MTLPTEFTVRQLARMAELVLRENSQRPNPEDHNLGRKLQEYCGVATRAYGFRRAG
ncbi:MAG TPA: hypothetical protein VLH80_07600 [Nitrospiraceae bacterium]|nr:hypothetical protein [Nitrospiraceae bacterium]